MEKTIVDKKLEGFHYLPTPEVAGKYPYSIKIYSTFHVAGPGREGGDREVRVTRQREADPSVAESDLLSGGYEVTLSGRTQT